MGDRTLMPEPLDELDTYESIQPPADAPAGYKSMGDLLYKGGSPDSPEIGDIRVTFSGVPVQTVSVMAEQRNASLTPFRTSSGYKIGLVAAVGHNGSESSSGR